MVRATQRGARFFRGAVFVVVGVVVFACDYWSTGPGGSTSKSHLTAVVDGVPWAERAQDAATAGALWSGPGAYGIGGFDSTNTKSVLFVSLFNVRAPGTYPLGVDANVVGGTASIHTADGGWYTPSTGAAGTITISTLTDAKIAGTFSFTGDSAFIPKGIALKTVSSGSFELPLRKTTTIGPIPDNAGSTIVGTVAGQPFYAGTIPTSTFSSAGQTTGSLLKVGGGNRTWGTGIVVFGVTGPGTYPINESGPMQCSVTAGGTIPFGQPVTNSWASNGAGSSGSVTITSITATRIKGSVTATLGPTPGTATTGTVSVSWSFDVGLP
jgi:hypothetical protein